MCVDLTIECDGDLTYHVTHRADGLHLTCDVGDTTDHHLVDQHIDGFTHPHAGVAMSILASPPLWTPVVRAVHRT